MPAAGFTDPLLAAQLGPDAPAAQVSLTYAFPSQEAPLAAFQQGNYTDLGPLLSPLIHQPTLGTGKAARQDPTAVRAWLRACVPAGYVAMPGCSMQGLLRSVSCRPPVLCQLGCAGLLQPGACR